MQYEEDVRSLAEKVGGLDKLRDIAEDLSWADEANGYWVTVVKCLETFHGMDSVNAQAECAELRTLLEAPLEENDDSFRWLYMHDEPFNMANSVSVRTGGQEIELTDELRKIYFEDICEFPLLQQ